MVGVLVVLWVPRAWAGGWKIWAPDGQEFPSPSWVKGG